VNQKLVEGGCVMAVSGFLQENRVSVISAVLAVIFIILTPIVSIIGGFAAVSEVTTGDVATGAVAAGGTVVIAVVFALISAILQAVVLYQWGNVINNNIKNTKHIFTHAKDQLQDPLRGEIGFFVNRLEDFLVQAWPFYIYLVLYIIAQFVGWYSFLLYLIGFVFLAIYLSNIFKATSKVSDMKDKIYSYLKGAKGYNSESYIFRIPQRSVALVIILSVITLGIYWAYILIKLSMEINEYVASDEKVRPELEKMLTT
jgi:uncharacterized membrane protein